MLALMQEYVFSLRPLIFFREDPSGHATKLCVFRKTEGDGSDRRLQYEIVGEATRWDQARVSFRTELDELRGLFGLGPD